MNWKVDRLVETVRSRVRDLTNAEEDEIREATRTGRPVVLRPERDSGHPLYYGRRRLVTVHQGRQT